MSNAQARLISLSVIVLALALAMGMARDNEGPLVAGVMLLVALFVYAVEFVRSRRQDRNKE